MTALFPEIKTAIQIKRSGGWCSDAVHREQFASSDTKLHNQVRFDLLLAYPSIKVLVCFSYSYGPMFYLAVYKAHGNRLLRTMRASGFA
jgi:hypothetical protein